MTSAPSAAAVTVNSALVAPTVTPTPDTVNQTQTSSLTSTGISTGTSSYSYQWFQEAPGAATYSAISGATTSSYSFATTDSTATGTWSFELQVTDSANTPVAVNSTAASVTLNAAPTATPTATPTTAPTATPTIVPTATATPTVTPTPTKNLLSLSFLLIVAIAVAAIVIVGAVSAFFVTRKKVTEKSLKKSSPRDFQDWVIKRFNGKPGDPTSGVDGYTAGGQPLLIKQSDNVSLAEVEDFVSTLMKTGAQKGAIVAFNYDKDADDGKMKALDQGIELEMLTIYQLVNKRFSDKIENITRMQVAFEAPREASPPVMTEDQGTVTFGGMPMPVPNEPQTDVLKNPVVFVSYSNTKVLDQVTKLLEFLRYDYAVGDNEETPVPISENKFGLMKNCDCAVIIISAIEQERRYSGIYVLNSNVLTEISAAFLKYYMQIVLVVERKVELPSNLKGLFRIEYDNDDLSFDAAMELEKILADFKKI